MNICVYIYIYIYISQFCLSSVIGDTARDCIAFVVYSKLQSTINGQSSRAEIGGMSMINYYYYYYYLHLGSALGINSSECMSMDRVSPLIDWVHRPTTQENNTISQTRED